MRVISAISLLASLFPVLACAQVATWLVPTDGATLSFRGPALSCERAFIKSGELMENRDSLAEWTMPDGSLRLPDGFPKPCVVGVDFEPAIEIVDLSRMGLATKAMVRHYRSTLTLVQGDGPTNVLLAKHGLRFETRLFQLPDRSTIGGDVPLRVYLGGDVVQGARVTFFPPGNDPVSAITEGSGFSRFALTVDGEWRVETILLRIVTGDPEVQYELFSCGLSFVVDKVEVPR